MWGQSVGTGRQAWCRWPHTQETPSKKQRMWTQCSLDNAKTTNLKLLEVSKKLEHGKNGIINLFIETTEKFQRLGKEVSIQISTVYTISNNHHEKRTSLWYIVIKTPEIKYKTRILKAVKEKQQIAYTGKPMRITTDFSVQSLKARRA